MLRKRHRPDWVQTLARELGRAIRPSSVFHALFRLVQALRCRDPDTGKALRGERSGSARTRVSAASRGSIGNQMRR